MPFVFKKTDIRVRETSLYFQSYQHRVPLKFGSQTVSEITAARACVRVEDRQGRSAEGWGETPMSVAWVWPSPLSWQERERRMREFCLLLAQEIAHFAEIGHPIEIGDQFQKHRLHALLEQANTGHAEPMPHLAALVCLSLFDLAIHDAFGVLHAQPVFATLGPEYLSTDLRHLLENEAQFSSLRPDAYLTPRKNPLPVWHLVGGLDPLETADLQGDEPDDGYPVVLRDWSG
jgi:L-alanine-DL-glutamate epimerase-like enolase superfamily enzyme